MAIVNFVRLPIAALCAVFLAVFVMNQVNDSKKISEKKQQSLRPLQARAPSPAVPVAPNVTQTTKANVEKSTADPTTAISAFRQWAETAAGLGYADADVKMGMELAKAHADAMKALIQLDTASALRHVLPADLRASLPWALAAAIKRPVKTSGLCWIRMMCKHSDDSPHSGCQETPVLLEDLESWNAFYGAQQWRSHLGKTVTFEGVAVDDELAVHEITPSPHKDNHNR
jgi:hypothetical protein